MTADRSIISLQKSQASLHCVGQALLYAFDMTMGKRIRAARDRADLTQDYVAAKLKISKQAVSQWERDEGRPDLDHLMPLSQILAVPVSWLLDGRGAPPSLNYQTRIEGLQAPDRSLIETVLDGLERKRGEVA